MKIIYFPHFYYLSEVSRLVEMGLALAGWGKRWSFSATVGRTSTSPKKRGLRWSRR